MQHSELLHRFFDEGLDEPLEDVLFGQMALDPDLRREFLSHLKLHSIVQQDMAGITTPSHISKTLFASLGMTPEASVPDSALGRLQQGVTMTLLGLRSLVYQHRRYLYTAVLSAVATSVIFLAVIGIPDVTGSLTDEDRGGTTLMEEKSADVTATEQTADNARHTRSIVTADGSASESAGRIPGDGQSTFARGTITALKPSEAVGKADTDNSVAVAHAGMPTLAPHDDNSGNRQRVISVALSDVNRTVDPSEGGARPEAWSQQQMASELLPRAPEFLGMDPSSIDLQHWAGQIPTDDIAVIIAESPRHDAPWLFSQPQPHSNILSNLVFELRKYYGKSFPDIDLPHNSHNVFENMAISVIYKTTEHHAFGFEYGREGFGREFQRSAVTEPAALNFDPSYEQVYEPPPQWIAGPQREHRMLDLFGAVWKLSLPEYGLFDIVYPYMRSFVGATRLGPLGKVRAGLEMYPSNFSALNVGIEGGMLRYTVDGVAYYTSRLNFTFGVAIGF